MSVHSSSMMSDQHRRNGILYGGLPFLLVFLPAFNLFMSHPLGQRLLNTADDPNTFVPPTIPFTLEHLPELLFVTTIPWTILLPLWLLFVCTQNDGIFVTTQRYRMWSKGVMIPLWLLSMAICGEQFLGTISWL